MLVSWPLALRDMDSAGGDGSSDWSSDSGSPATAWERRRSLASSWDGSWYLQAAGEGTAGRQPPGRGAGGGRSSQATLGGSGSSVRPLARGAGGRGVPAGLPKAGPRRQRGCQGALPEARDTARGSRHGLQGLLLGAELPEAWASTGQREVPRGDSPRHQSSVRLPVALGQGEPGSGPRRRRGVEHMAGAGASTAAHSGQEPHEQERKHI